MVSAADAALQRAAERARRRADLEVALAIVQRRLGYEIDTEHHDLFPWVSVLSMPYEQCIDPCVLYWVLDVCDVW